jgi:hypothetical protein
MIQRFGAERNPPAGEGAADTKRNADGSSRGTMFCALTLALGAPG